MADKRKKQTSNTVKKTANKPKASAVKSKSSNKDKKKLIYAAIILVVVIISIVIIAIAAGLISISDIENFLSSLLDDNNLSPSPSISPSPSTNTTELTDNILLIGNELSGIALKIHIIDVGQGDCILIELPDGKKMLIDGGDNKTSVESAISNYLNNLNIVTLDYVMLTHTDSDHVGSLDYVLDNYEVKELYIPNLTASYGLPNASTIPQSISTLGYKRFIDRTTTETYTLSEEVFAATVIYNENIITFDEPSYRMVFYCPEPEYYQTINNNSSAKKKNDASPVVLIEYGGRTIILTGDADLVGENRFINQVGDAINADILKVGHHGSAGSSNQAFLAHIDVEYALISCGVNNSHKHPRQAVIDRLLDSGVEYIFRTDLHSDILVEIDPSGNMRFTLKQYVTMDIAFIGFSDTSED